jgi:protein-L-isoaspartate(D-aspartate) O-methyltransferase
MQIKDTHLHQGLRKRLIEKLKAKGIDFPEVIAAIAKVPRHVFFDEAFREMAYDDIAFQIGAGQTISHPSTVAFQTQLLELKKGEKVLEIGTGSGYQTCILMEMGVKVFTIERQKSLYDKTKLFLPEMGYSPRFFYGDGFAGLPAFAPFDKVIITCGAPFVPQELLKQLKTGGIMVIPVGEGEKQTMWRLVKIAENQYDKDEFGQFSFVPMLEKKAKDK